MLRKERVKKEEELLKKAQEIYQKQIKEEVSSTVITLVKQCEIILEDETHKKFKNNVKDSKKDLIKINKSLNDGGDAEKLITDITKIVDNLMDNGIKYNKEVKLKSLKNKTTDMCSNCDASQMMLVQLVEDKNFSNACKKIVSKL